MRKISLSILLFISLSVVSQGVPGIATDYIRFKTLELPKDQRWGLITAIAQDSTGFMWLATWSGLHRFDGTRFTDYNHDDLIPIRLHSNAPNAFLQIKAGISMWVHTVAVSTG